jgi:dsRNA-specific ribonuclease
VVARLQDGTEEEGEGATKKEAEMEAAGRLLSRIGREEGAG